MADQVPNKGNLSVTADGTTIGYLKDSIDDERSADSQETTNLGDAVRTYVQGLKEPGDLTVMMALDETDPGNVLVRTLYDSGENVPWVVTHPNGATVTQTGHVTRIGRSIRQGEIMMRAVTVKLSGGQTIAAGGGA